MFYFDNNDENDADQYNQNQRRRNTWGLGLSF